MGTLFHRKLPHPHPNPPLEGEGESAAALKLAPMRIREGDTRLSKRYSAQVSALLSAGRRFINLSG